MQYVIVWLSSCTSEMHCVGLLGLCCMSSAPCRDRGRVNSEVPCLVVQRPRFGRASTCSSFYDALTVYALFTWAFFSLLSSLLLSQTLPKRGKDFTTRCVYDEYFFYHNYCFFSMDAPSWPCLYVALPSCSSRDGVHGQVRIFHFMCPFARANFICIVQYEEIWHMKYELINAVMGLLWGLCNLA